MKTLIKLFLLIVILHVFFAGCSDTSENDASEDELETAIVATDKKATTIALIIEEVTAVTTPTIDTTPNYTDFNSTNTFEVLSLGIPYSKSGAQLIFGLGYNF